MNWNTITSEEQLNTLSRESEDYPVMIFKHSTTCPISGTALNRMERNWDNQKAGSLKPYLLDLLRYRAISNAIVEKFGVSHESPQVILIRNGKAVYDESHFGISFGDVIQTLNSPN